MEKIRILIADDNVHICQMIFDFLKRYDDIEILGIANTDEDEIKLIEDLKPQIVISDIMRNHKCTGLDIIKRYYEKKSNIKFLVISAIDTELIINSRVEIAGFIKKPFGNYEIIYNELLRIKNDFEYKNS